MASSNQLLKYSAWLSGGYNQFCSSTPSSPNNNRCYPMSSTPIKSGVQGVGQYSANQCMPKSFWDALYFPSPSLKGRVTVRFTADYYTTNYDAKFYSTGSSSPSLTYTSCGSVGTAIYSMHKLSDGNYECYKDNNSSWSAGYYYFFYDTPGGTYQYLRYAIIFNLSSSNVSTLNGGTSVIVNASSVVGLNPW